MGAASVLMVAGVALLAESPASAVGAGTTTVTTSASPAATSPFGTSVTITATVSNPSPAGTPSGNVTFQYTTNAGPVSVTGCTNPATLASGSATCVTTALPAGTTSLDSVYNGDSMYAVSPSATLPYLVTGTTASSVGVSATPSSPVVVGSNIVITATVPSPESGTVNFEYSTNGSSYSTVSGCGSETIAGTTATCPSPAPLPLGTVDLEAVYSGDTTYATSTSAAYPYSVTAGTGTDTVSLLATPASPVSAGTTVYMTATVLAGTPSGVPTGAVTFESSTNGVTYIPVTGCTNPATLSSGTTTCNSSLLPFGTVDLEAVYSGSSTYGAATSPALSYDVRTTSATTIGAAPPSPTPYGTTVTLTSTVTSGATGTVNFEDSANDVTFTSIAGCTAQVVSVTYVATCATAVLPTGVNYLEAVYSGNVTYAPSTSTPITYNVSAATQTAVTVTSIAGLVGTPLVLVASGGSGTGAITFNVVNGTATGCVITGTSLKVTTAGTCLVTATKAADANHVAASSVATTVTFVNPIPKAIRVIGTPYVGKTTTIGIAGQYFFGQPTIITNAARTVAKVSKDSGSLLTVQVTVKSGTRAGVYVFAITFKNGLRTNVKYSLR